MLFCTSTFAQQPDPAQAPARIEKAAPAQPDAGQNAAQTPDKRIFGVLPNYRTVEDTGGVEPITARRKFYIAVKDSFDYPIYFLAGAFAGVSQIENQNPSFGQGLKGYGKRYGGAYGDLMIGNLMAEGLFPGILHEDPRYYRRGTGGTWQRTAYALTRVLVTHTDSGGKRFNFSEVVGNSVTVAISNTYYPDTRSAAENLEKLGMQIGTDAVSNVLKEFWPDVKRKLQRSHSGTP
ncbi:MAG TPA: hypothetical protein VJN43_16250 [Bryobacteraceae bacterium]|nr:hypothetical protein [Bryobacteraceae bacterium]